MQEIVSQSTSKFPPLSDIAKAFHKIEAHKVTFTQIIKLDRVEPFWVYGAEQIQADKDSVWAVNPRSFTHGYVCWVKKEFFGEVLAPIHEPLPDLEPAPDASEKGWTFTLGMTMKCWQGADKGIEARYTSNSKGGKEFLAQLSTQIAQQINTGSDTPVPLIKLGYSTYPHKTYGKIKQPEFEIVGWAGLDEVPNLDNFAESEEEIAPTRRLRRPN